MIDSSAHLPENFRDFSDHAGVLFLWRELRVGKAILIDIADFLSDCLIEGVHNDLRTLFESGISKVVT